MTSGLALLSRETRLRLLTVRGHILDVFKMPSAATDPEATKLCAVLALTEEAIEILQQQAGSQAAPGLPAGDSK